MHCLASCGSLGLARGQSNFQQILNRNECSGLPPLQDMIQMGSPRRAKTPEGAEDSADKLTWVRNLGTLGNSWSKGLGDVLEKSGLDKNAQDNIKFVLSGERRAGAAWLHAEAGSW
jgi:hypothetical protein